MSDLANNSKEDSSYLDSSKMQDTNVVGTDFYSFINITMVKVYEMGLCIFFCKQTENRISDNERNIFK